MKFLEKLKHFLYGNSKEAVQELQKDYSNVMKMVPEPEINEEPKECKTKTKPKASTKPRPVTKAKTKSKSKTTKKVEQSINE